MFIKSIRIKNFRSIIDETIELGNMTTFVGENDAGKSNVLRALNLFFNNETAPGVPFNFQRDYSKFAVEGKKQAQKIKIAVELTPPRSYKDVEVVTWKREWRANTLTLPMGKRLYDGKEKRPNWSKVNSWLDSLSFKYIPTVKSEQYFSYLLEDLHDVLSMTVREAVKNASGQFIQIIREHTEQITMDLQKDLDLSSNLQLPEDLRQLFNILDFETGIGESQNVSLKCRGDGIKSRHIPIILKFIAEQSNMLGGKSKRDVIWGYEEPENNLEMSYAYKLAARFSDYSKSIQIILTTHSPVFYSMGEKKYPRYNVVKNNEGKALNSRFLSIENTKELDKTMGLMQLVSPYIKEKMDEIKALKRSIKENPPMDDAPMIFVEGDFDKKIIQACISKICPKNRILIESAGGADCVQKKVVGVRLYGGFKNKFLGVVDNDDAGRKAYSKLERIFPGESNSENYKLMILRRPEHMANIIEEINEVKVCLESYLPLEYWKFAEKESWIEPNNIGRPDKIRRPNAQTLRLFREQTELQIRQNLTEYEQILALNELKEESKGKFAKYAANCILMKGVPPSLRVLIDEILDFFDGN